MNRESLGSSQYSRGFRILFTLILLFFLEPYKMIDVLIIYIYSLYRATIYWSAWWFGLEHCLFFHILGMSSSQLTFIFSKGVGSTTNQWCFDWKTLTTSRKGSNSSQKLCSGLCGRKHCSSSMLCLRSRRGTAMGLWMVDMDRYIYIYIPMVNDG